MGKACGFSPPTRGGSLRTLPRAVIEKLFPAHAGVILMRTTYANRQQSFPRPRGGDPNLLLLS